jgi:hypothetical protein
MELTDALAKTTLPHSRDDHLSCKPLGFGKKMVRRILTSKLKTQRQRVNLSIQKRNIMQNKHNKGSDLN